MSPTINLWINKEDFIIFVKNLKGFLSAELIELKSSEQSYPVGIIKYNNQSVTINFMHYKTFEEAKEKWDERKKRVNFNNIFIIQLIGENLTNEDIDKFNSIPFTNKLLITYENNTNNKNIITHPVFLKDYIPGKILRYKSRFSLKRYMDDIDYVSFLNKTDKKV